MTDDKFVEKLKKLDRKMDWIMLLFLEVLIYVLGIFLALLILFLIPMLLKGIIFAWNFLVQ